MSWFWIVGIVLNVGLTVAAIVWVIRQGRPRNDPPQAPGAADDPPKASAPPDDPARPRE
jgi:hypothetical protein